MIKQKQFEHNGHTYTIATIPGRKGLKMSARLGKIVIPAAKAYYFSENERSMADEITSVILDNIDDPAIEQIIVDMVATVWKDNMAINFDEEFAGNYGDLFKICKEVFSHNFGSVFSLVGSASE